MPIVDSTGNTYTTTGSDGIWSGWTATKASSMATTATSMTSDVWLGWTAQVYGNNVSTADSWGYWTTSSNAQARQPNYGEQPIPARANIERIQVKRRARDLLRSVLSAEQWEDWERYRSVRIVGQSGALYEVVDGWAYELQGGIAVRKYCWHGVGHFCLEDRIAAIILKLRTNEDRFLIETHHNDFRRHEVERVRLRRHTS